MVVNLLTSLGDADGSDQFEMGGHWDLIRYQEFALLNHKRQLNKQTGLRGASSTYVSCKTGIKGACKAPISRGPAPSSSTLRPGGTLIPHL